MPVDSKELVRAGKLSEARQQLTEEIKASPSDAGKRTMLFQVLSFLGEWDKAERHLDTLALQNPNAETGAQVYKNLIQGEKERIEVVKSRRRPSFLPETPPYLEKFLTACEKVKENKFTEADELFSEIESELPLISGTFNGKDFTGFRDTDTFLSHFIEAFVHGHYIWIPVQSIRELSISAPKTLFDLLWITAHITTWEGLTISCFLPVLYPDSFLHEDERVKLGRVTDWIPLGGSFLKGAGQHVFQIGEDENAILEFREVFFKIAESADDGGK